MEGRHISIAAIGLAVVLVGFGCQKPPNQALNDAEDAVAQARKKSECAEEKFRAAERLLGEAKELKEEKKYKKAERKANAAAKLAREAREKAEANWEECQKRLASKKTSSKDEGEGRKQSERSREGRDEERFTLQTIYFGYDSAELSSEARERLEQNVKWLENHPDRKIVLEGHTDARGSIEYNLALGEQRAKTVKGYLVQMGVSADRLRVLSYGEEKPAAYGSTEEAYRKNRRVEFVPK